MPRALLLCLMLCTAPTSAALAQSSDAAGQAEVPPGATDTSPSGSAGAEGAAEQDNGQGEGASDDDAPATAAQDAAPIESATVLVPSFKGVGEVAPGELDTITGLVVYQVNKVKALEVVTAADIQEMLAVEANKAAIGCSEEDSCLNEIADALGADLILAGRVGRLGPRYLIQLTLIDTAQAKPVARAQLQVRSVTQVGAEVVGAVHALTLAYGGLPDIDEQKRQAAAAESRTSYAGRFVDFATEPDTVMLFAMFAGALFALVPPIAWVAPIVQGVLLWWLGDDIAGREYPRWWLAIPAGWAVYLAALVVAGVTGAVGVASAQLIPGLGLIGGGGLVVSGASAAVLMVFMLEPVVAWWAGTWGAHDVALFDDGEDGAIGSEPDAEMTPATDDETAGLGRPASTAPAVQVRRAIGRATTWARSGAR